MTRKLFATVLISAFALAAAFIAPPKGDARASTARNGTIAFSSSRPPGDSSAPQVYTVEPDGSNLSPALTTGLSNGDPSWSPDGTQIAFSTFEFAGSPCCNSIAIMNADGTNHHKAVNGTDVGSGYISGPAWSPDGTKLAFHVGPDGDSHIWTSNADGSNPTQLTFGAQSDYFPAWSPDGTRIAFESNREGGYDIYSMNADGSDVQQLTSMDGPEELPAWSPDGSKIAFDNHPITGGYQIWLMDADGSNQTKIFGSSSENDTSAAWSPDGTKLAFVSDRDNDSHRKIWTINADGSSPTRVTNPSGGSDDYPSWGGVGGGGGGGDSQAPVVTITLDSPGGSTPDGFEDWFRFAPVDVTVTADDSSSGDSAITALDCGPVSFAKTGIGTTKAVGKAAITTDGVVQLSCTATDAAGNRSAAATEEVKLDATMPLVQRAPANDTCSGPISNGWCRGFSGLAAYTITDATSGGTGTIPGVCDPGATCTFFESVHGQGQLPSNFGAACDVAGNCVCDIPNWVTGRAFCRSTIDPLAPYALLDEFPPAVSRKTQLDSCSVPGANGWCRGTQTAGFTASDGVSGVGSPCSSPLFGSCDFTKPNAGEGSAVTISSGQVCDAASNCADAIDAGPFKVDSTPPTLAPTLSSSHILLHGNATATPNATDAISGVAGQSCGTVDTSTAGMHSVTCTATDNAGNSASTTVSYLVEYKLLGFFAPAAGAKVQRGSIVVVRVALADANGVRISDKEALGLISPSCRVAFSATGAQSASACTTYYTTSKEFHYDWRLGPRTGNVTISVTVSYPGTRATTVLSESLTIGI